jgi:hypothetical protein
MPGATHVVNGWRFLEFERAAGGLGEIRKDEALMKRMSALNIQQPNGKGGRGTAEGRKQ